MSGIKQQWDSLVIPEDVCGIHQACGMCEECKRRARKVLERLVSEVSKKRHRRNPLVGQERVRAVNRMNRMLCMLDVFPVQVTEEEKEKLNSWAWYCTSMHALGRRGSVRE